jgi:hypothetical protein
MREGCPPAFQQLVACGVLTPALVPTSEADKVLGRRLAGRAIRLVPASVDHLEWTSIAPPGL